MIDSVENEDLSSFLEPTYFIDSDNADVRAYADSVAGTSGTDVERGVRLFYGIRDQIRYDPYNILPTRDHFIASAVLARRVGFCVPKAILLAAVARANGIPSRLRFADVRNHLATKRLLEVMRTDVFGYHGYTELHLDGRWVKATTTFNLSLCEKFGVQPLEFDGRSDAVFHPFDKGGRRHMEYVRDHGWRADFPLEEMIENWLEVYPHFFEPGFFAKRKFVDFEAEAAEE